MPGERSTCQSKMVIMYLLSKTEAVGHDDQGVRKLKHNRAVHAIISTLWSIMNVVYTESLRLPSNDIAAHVDKRIILALQVTPVFLLLCITVGFRNGDQNILLGLTGNN